MKTIKTIEDISILKESSELECKLAQGRDGKGAIPKDMWETYSAFANSSGGDIFLGLKEKKGSFELVGIENTGKVLDELWTSLNNRKKVSANILRKEWVNVIERAGSGLPKIKQGWIAQGHSLELYDDNTPYNQTIIELNWYIPEEILDNIEGTESTQVTGQVTGQVTLEIKNLIISCTGELSRKELMEKMQLKSRENFEKRYLKPALTLGIIERTIPDKPNSRLQKYRLTDAGFNYLEISISSENGSLGRE